MAYGPWKPVSLLGSGPDGSRLLVRNGMGNEAIVTLLERKPDERLRKRLRLLASLSSPDFLGGCDETVVHDPTTQDSGFLPIVSMGLDDEPPWLATSRPPALTLAQRLDNGPLALVDLARLAARLAQGLASAHKLGVANGRINPARIYLWADNNGALETTGLQLRKSETESTWQERCRPPTGPRIPGDIWSLGMTLLAAALGRPGSLADLGQRANAISSTRLQDLLRSMLASELELRPTAAEVARKLAALVARTDEGYTLADTGEELTEDMPAFQKSEMDARHRTLGPGSQIGRFQLEEQIGEGGMGTVFTAVDLGDESVVAIKVMQNLESAAVARFEKEARILEQVRSPNVANLIEVNRDKGVLFLALELVEGISLKEVFELRQLLPERVALHVAKGIAQALASAHRRGIVHRDIKPGNVLLPGVDRHDVSDDALLSTQVKLIDFGIAREIDQSSSMELTGTGTAMGSPFYMSPEQCGGGKISPATDVYGLTTTLFHMLAGRPPFDDETVMGVMVAHLQRPPPKLSELAPNVDPDLDTLLARGMAKKPGARFQDAEEMLDALAGLLKGATMDVKAHPSLPNHNPDQLHRSSFELRLRSTPQQLWPYVSNTDRLNRVVGLPVVDYAITRDSEVPRYKAQAKISGLKMEWTEHPYEWVEGERFAILREMSTGPIAWYVNSVQLEEHPTGGTLLVQEIAIMPRNIAGRAVGSLQGWRARRGFSKAYHKIDRLIQGELSGSDAVNPFGEAASLSTDAERILRKGLTALRREGVAAGLVSRIESLIRHSHPSDAARIRPWALADRWEEDREDVATAFLKGAANGLFRMLWDIICPSCRIPSEFKDSLKALEDHGHCEACDIDYELDFANSVELIFQVDPDLRDTEIKIYCIGGPYHAPHVVAQVRLAPGERLTLPTRLEEGSFRFRSAQLPGDVELRTRQGCGVTRAEVTATSAGWQAEQRLLLEPEQQRFMLSNEQESELLIRLERKASRDDALTAARASAMEVFRERFPNEVLERGRLVNVQHSTFALFELPAAASFFDELGNAGGFARLDVFFEAVRQVVARNGGGVVKAVGAGGVLAVFSSALDALEAMADLRPQLAGYPETVEEPAKVALHQGPAVVANLDDRLDYFGQVMTSLLEMPSLAGPDEWVVSSAIAGDQQGAAWLQHREPRLVDRDETWVLLGSLRGQPQTSSTS